MDDALTVSVSAARDAIAAAVLGRVDGSSRTLGEIELRPHQRLAAARLIAGIDAHRGALLADPVGLGKTYTALAVVAHFGGVVAIVAPAALRDMWASSLAAANIRAQIVSHEALSRGERFAADFIVVDEAHRFRSISSRRYATLADLSRRARVLLVSATPIQNSRTDLAAQLGIFLGRRAWSLSPDEMAAHVVRAAADEASTLALSALRGPAAIDLAIDDDILDLIVALPPPVPAKDESVAAALLLYGLVHQWSSSHAALAAALRRRKARAHALLAALDAGRMPTRADLAAWTHVDDAVQLAFPQLIVSHAEPDVDVAEMQTAIDRHLAGIDAILTRLRSTLHVDRARADALRRIRRAHPSERVIAFCHYAETVHVLRSLLAQESGVAALTASGARVAGGRISRDDVIAQFSPRASRRVSRAERIDLLVTTDLLSEGLNLQEASVVVHLDLPWNPARLDQRVGRVRRMGSTHATVSVYTVLPPAPANRLLRIDRRLREKLRAAHLTVGIAGRILPPAIDPDARATPGLSEQTSLIRAMLRDWCGARDLADPHDTRVRVATVPAARPGFLAAIAVGAKAELIADVGDGISRGSQVLLDAVRIVHSSSGESAAHVSYPERTIDRIRRWLLLRQGSDAIDLGQAAAARARRDALMRVSRALARTPRHKRSMLAPLAEAARAVATAPFGEGAERILETLVRSELPDEAWLRSIVTFGEVNARPQATDRDEEPRILAVILFGRQTL